MPSLLIAYTTSHNTTHEISAHVASTLQPILPNWRIDVLPVQSIPPPTRAHKTSPSTSPLTPYTTILLPSNIHFGRRTPASRTFLTTHLPVLRTKPIYAFSVGMPATPEIRATEERDTNAELRAALGDALRGEAPLFQGKFEKEDVGWWGRLFIGCFVREEGMIMWGDGRDWGVIEVWARKVGEEIRGMGEEAGKKEGGDKD